MNITDLFKKYWYLLLIAVIGVAGFILTLSGHAKAAALLNLLKGTTENYKKQINVLNNLESQRDVKQQQIEKKSDITVKQILDKKEVQLKQVQVEKEQTVMNVKVKSTEDIAKQMKEEFKL